MTKRRIRVEGHRRGLKPATGALIVIGLVTGLHFGPVPPLEGRARLVSGEAAGDDPLLQGRVRLPSGQPVAGARVRLFDLDGLHRVAEAATDESGWFSLSSTIPAPSLPRQFHLGQNYPNPFNPSTTIPFHLPVSSRVRLDVYNLLGQRVATLVDGELPAGFHSVRWDATDSAGRPAGAGLYLYRLLGGGMNLTGRMVLIDGQAGLHPLSSDHGALPAGGEAVMETGTPVLGLTVSGPGLVPFVDPAFRPEGGGGPVDLVVEEEGASRGKVVAEGLLGDVDNNGLVDVVDVLLLMVYTLDSDQLSVPVPSEANLALGDVNRDGVVDVSDALSVLAYLVDPLDPSLPPGIGEPVETVASLSPDPATVSFRPDGAWHRFSVLSSERVEIVVNPPGSERNLEITVLRGLPTHCPPEEADRFPRNNGQFVYLAACGEGTGTVELRRTSDGALLRTYAFPVGGAARMYWTGHDVRTVRRADVDGSDIQDLVPTGAYAAGFALDLEGGKMYWTDVGAGRINRADLDGTNTQRLISAEVGSINWLALDVPGGKMYWTDWTTDKIQRANLDGSDIEDLVTTGLVAPHGLALDLAAGKMYWTDNGAARIQRANLDGSGMENLVTGLGVPRGLALDSAVGKMYWTDAGTHKIQRANLDGSNVEDLVVSGVDAPHGLALDLVRGWMYWTDIVTNKIQRANLDGSNVEDLITSGLSRPWGLTLDTSYTGRPGAGTATLSPDPSTIAI
ncbi:MAG: dockerin type I domain-containing protein, partial [Acidobacteria bacterium]|nr:dockerin type I domain-containing protein [Acidobacteriota bacterium]